MPTTTTTTSDTQPLWGIDLGGTKIEGAIVDPVRRDRALWRVRVPTESARGYEHIVGQVWTLVERLESASGLSRPRTIGFATPGAIEPATGTMKNCNTVCLNGRPLRDDLTVQVIVDVHAQPAPTPPTVFDDPLWDLPLEVVTGGDRTDPVTRGEQLPPGYTLLQSQTLSFPLGRMRTSDVPPFVF